MSTLTGCSRNNGYNKLVLAQHLDDMAESFIMSSLHNGKVSVCVVCAAVSFDACTLHANGLSKQLRTMKAHYRIDSEDLSVIRPLAYTREAYTR